MEAKNYRIGNYIQYNNENKSVGRITTLVSDFVSRLDYCQIDYVINKKHWLINVNPIPITEEWLLKLGFISNAYQDRYESNCIHIQCDKLKGKTDLYIEGMPHIKHIHQLQNLYFSITGEELEIKK